MEKKINSDNSSSNSSSTRTTSTSSWRHLSQAESLPLVSLALRPPKSYGSLFPYYNFMKKNLSKSSSIQSAADPAAMSSAPRGRSTSMAVESTQSLCVDASPKKRRVSSFLHIPVREAAAGGTHGTSADGSVSSRGSLTGSVSSQLHYLHLPTFSFTAPPNEKRFSFNLGLRRHSNVSLHRSESMVSLCFRSLATFVADNNFPALQAFLENKQIQIDDRNENGATALMVAATKGRVQFVRELLAHGADANAEDADGWTALLCAAKEGFTDICLLLVSHGSTLEHRDSGGWTALMWASYKGRIDAVTYLVDQGADVNAHGNYHISSLLWAAGRGYVPIVQTLVAHGAKVNVGDKYGTSALVWACRKGNADIVECLLRAGANVDTAGMYSWTALLVASMGNFVDVVNLLLEHKPNVNALDKDGCTALTIACKEGYHDIVVGLLNAGAYINIQDRAGDTNLIHAVKGNHRSVVEALLKKYADVDTTGKDRKTAVYNAVEKSNINILKMLLNANPDLEIATKDGDTPLLRAVRIRNVEIVQLLLDKKAKVSAADRKGDTCLHVAMRARSKAIVETLLRNPKHSQLLYRPNRQGETPYNIDVSHQKTILGQIFGARRLNTNEDNENMLGYDLYSSALADILSEPSLSMPITVGLYAKWGSGKSFLLNKLREEMKNFARQWIEPSFHFSVLFFVLIAHLSLIIGAIVGIASRNMIAALSSGIGCLIIVHVSLAVVQYIGQKYDWDWPYNFNASLTRKLNSLKLIFQVMFCHPPGLQNAHGITAQPIRFYFTDQTRVSSTTSGENSVVQMLGSLYESIENEYGTISTRLYRAFRPKSLKDNSSWRWRRLCCLPYIIIFELSFISTLLGACILTAYLLELNDPTTMQIILITIGLLLGIAIVANLYTWARMLRALTFSQRRHLQRSICNLDTLKSEGFLQVLRYEVTLMTDMIKCLDRLTSQQTRLVIIVDGLDSCEQDKVLLVLDAVHMLFSDVNSPFIVILAIDPHAISKAVEVNSKRLFSESNIGGHDYLRNMVHLPFYLQNSGMRRVKVAQHTATVYRRSGGGIDDHSAAGPSTLGRSVSSRRLSTESGLMSSCEKLKPPPPRKGSRKLKLSDSIASSIGSNLNRIGGAQDLTKMLLTDDYFSDVNPRSMRRLMNVVYVTGRLLKAFQIDFNWYHLASWINITEQWPFRTSWIILYHEMHEEAMDDSVSLKNLYDKIRRQIPILRDVEPLLELDRDERKFDIFLTFHRSSLLISDLKIFLPFTINLDPYIKKVIKEEQQGLEEDGSLIGSARPNPSQMTPAGPMQWNQGPMQMWSPVVKSNTQRRQRPFGNSNMSQSSDLMYQTTPKTFRGWPSSQWFENSPQIAYPPVNQMFGITKIPKDILQTKLSTLTTDGVSDLLCKIEDMSPSMRIRYSNLIKENNVNGRVLFYCDLDELKQVLVMNFGDWELFRMLVVCLRDQEMQMVGRDEQQISASSSKIARGSIGSASGAQGSSTSSAGQSNTGVPRTSGDKVAASQTDHTTPVLGLSVSGRSTTKQTTIEKQVTLEEQMICGALQTLNEEACEDVLENEDGSSEESSPESITCSLTPLCGNTEQGIQSSPRFSEHTVVLMPPQINNVQDPSSFSLLNTSSGDVKVTFITDIDQSKL